MLSIGGTCEGVTQDSGLLVIMGDDASEPLTEITLNLQENNSEFSDDVSNSEKSLPSQNSNDIVLVDNTFSLYVDPQQKFSIKYPSNWIVDSTNYGAQKVLFLNEENWKAQIYVVTWGEIDYAELSSSEIFDNIVSYEQEFCNDATFVDSGQICYDFQLGGTDIGASGSDQKEYIVSYDATLQYDGLIGVEYPTTTLLIEKHDGSNAWTVFVDVETEYYESFVDVLVESAVSFEVIKSGESSSTTNSIPIPIPIPQPDIITSTGTATLSETSVNISSGQSEQIKIYGTINDVDKSTRVSITYTYPDGTTDGGTIFTTNTGVYETYLNLDKNSPIGNYEILVTAKGKIIGSLNLQVNDKILDSHPFVENEISSEITSHPTIESVPNLMPETIPEPPLVEPLGIASFVDTSKDPQHYIDRYNNEPAYKEWFDENYSQHSSIYEAVGLVEPLGIASFVDTSKDPQSYVDRYNNEESYQEWFDSNYSQYYSIYEAVGLSEPVVEPVVEHTSEPVVEYTSEPVAEVTPTPNCGSGTELVNGVCQVVQTEEKSSKGGGCLIATATYGSEMSQQVQQLRELRDNQLLQTESGTSFMNTFNDIYYSFSPTIADMEREHPMFKEAVKLAITPMITSLSLMENANSESEVLGIGISVIALNFGMYLGIPAIVIVGIKKKF
jgi:hypothetical protein